MHVITLIFILLLAAYTVAIKYELHKVKEQAQEPKRVHAYVRRVETGFVTLLDSSGNIIGWYYDSQLKICK
jgi:sensor domain CHASE-containing protein